MSDIKDMKRQTKQNIKHLRDILTGIDMMCNGESETNKMVAYTFTQKLIHMIHEGELSPKAIEAFLTKEDEA